MGTVCSFMPIGVTAHASSVKGKNGDLVDAMSAICSFMLFSVAVSCIISKVGQGSCRDLPMTRLGETHRVSLGDGGDPRH